MNVFIRKSAQPGDSDNGMFFTTFFSVMILSPAAAILGIAGNTPSWNTAGVLWFVVAGILASLLGRATLFAGIGAAPHTGRLHGTIRAPFFRSHPRASTVPF